MQVIFGIIVTILAMVVIVLLVAYLFWVNSLMIEKGYGSGFGWVTLLFPFMGIVFLLMPYRQTHKPEVTWQQNDSNSSSEAQE